MSPSRALLPCLAALLLAALLLAGCPSTPPDAPSGSSTDDGGAAQSPPSDPDATEDVVLRITGMTCPVICPKEVRQMLAEAPGVVRVSVDWEERSATCTVRAGTDPQTLLASLRSPYTARVAH